MFNQIVYSNHFLDVEETEMVDYFENFDWEKIITPINVDQYREMLEDAGYDNKLKTKLILGFSQGFDIGYTGPEERTDYSKNIPLNIGTPTQLWNKVMAEVNEKHYTGLSRKN